MNKGTMLFTGLLTICITIGLNISEARAEKKIGMFLFSDETRYIQARDGVVDQLKKAGFSSPAVRFLTENAGGNKAKAAEIARKLHAARPDMIVAVGTSAAVAAAMEIKDIPIVFTMVYDPVDSKIAESWTSSGNNTTGASPRVPMSKLLAELKHVSPVKRLAVLYTPGEKNSEAQLKDLLAEQGASGIRIVPVPLTVKAEVPNLMFEVTSSMEAIFLTGSSIVGFSLDVILDAASKAKVITVSHLDDFVDKGALFGVCADPYAVGQLAGEKAVKVLNGAKPAAVPIEAVKKWDVIVNRKTARASQIHINDTFKARITKNIE